LATLASQKESSESSESSSSGFGDDNSDTVSEEAVPSTILSRHNSGSVFSDVSSGVDAMKNKVYRIQGGSNAGATSDVKNSTAGVGAGNLFVVPKHRGISYGLLEDPAYELDYGDSKFDDLSGKWGARKEKYEALYESTATLAQPVVTALAEEPPEPSKELEKSQAPKTSFWPLKMFSLNLPARKSTTEEAKEFSNVMEGSDALQCDKERKTTKKRPRYSALTTTQIPAFNEPLNTRVDKTIDVPVFVSSSAADENKPKGMLPFFRRAEVARRGEPFGRNLKFFEGTQGHSTKREATTQQCHPVQDRGSESADGVKQSIHGNHLNGAAAAYEELSEHPDKQLEHAITTPGHSPSPPGSLSLLHTERNSGDVGTLAVSPSRNGETNTIEHNVNMKSNMPPGPRDDGVCHSMVASTSPIDLHCIASATEQTVNENCAGGSGEPGSLSDVSICETSIPAPWGLGKAKSDGELLVSWGERHDSNSIFGESGTSLQITYSGMEAKAEDQSQRLAHNRSPYGWQETERSYGTSGPVGRNETDGDHDSATNSEVDVDAVSWITPIILTLEQRADGLPSVRAEGVNEDVVSIPASPKVGLDEDAEVNGSFASHSIGQTSTSLESIPASSKVGLEEEAEVNGCFASHSIGQSDGDGHIDTTGKQVGEMLQVDKDDCSKGYEASSLGQGTPDIQQERIDDIAFVVDEGKEAPQKVQHETLQRNALVLQGASAQRDPEGIPTSHAFSDQLEVSDQAGGPHKVEHETCQSNALFVLQFVSGQHHTEGVPISFTLLDEHDVPDQDDGVVEHKAVALCESNDTHDTRHAVASTSPPPEIESLHMHVYINDGNKTSRRGDTETAAISARPAELDHVLEPRRNNRLDDNSIGSSDADASEAYPHVNFPSEGVESSASAGLEAENKVERIERIHDGKETLQAHDVNSEYNSTHFGSSTPLRSTPITMCMDSEVVGTISDESTQHSITSSRNAGIDCPSVDVESEMVSNKEQECTLATARQSKVTIIEANYASDQKTLNPASDSDTLSGSSSGTDSGTYFGSSYSGSYSDSEYSRSYTTSESNADSSYRETHSEHSAKASGSTGDAANSDLENQISHIRGLPPLTKALLHEGSKSGVRADGGAIKPKYSTLYTPERLAFLMRNVTQSTTPFLSVDTDVVPDLEAGVTRGDFHDNDAPERNPIYLLANKYSSLNFGIDSFSDEMDEENQAVQFQEMPPCRSHCTCSWKLWTVLILGVVMIVSIAVGVSLTGSKPSSSTQAPSPPTFAPTLAFENREWMQLGDAFEGADLRDQAGFVVALSTDGRTVAVGARRSSAYGLINRGNVKIYRFEFHRWYLVGDLHGIDARNQFGFSVSISENGERVAIGSVGDDTNGNNSGMVEVYEHQDSSWTQIGQFHGRAAGDIFGTSVSLSADGRLVAVGAPYSSGAVDLPGSGEVYFFEDIGFDSPRWVESRQKISGTAGNDYFGWSVSLSTDGDVVAIGAPLDGVRTDPGYVCAFAYTGINDEWTRLGQTLHNVEGGDRFGYAVSIDGTGSHLAVGAFRGTNGLGVATGNARVFRFDGEIWNSLGQVLAGESESSNFGFSVSLTPEGDFLAVGAPNQSNRPGTGMASVFTIIDEAYWVSSVPIMSDVDQSSLGFSVSLTSSATMIAVGMPTANEARVYS
jgi:hypothetical protein